MIVPYREEHRLYDSKESGHSARAQHIACAELVECDVHTDIVVVAVGPSIALDVVAHAPVAAVAAGGAVRVLFARE